MATEPETDPSVWRAEPTEPREPISHAASGHRWVIRTPDGDEMGASYRLATSWPLLRMYAVRQFHLRYRQSAVGVAWTVLQPVALVAIYGFVFYNVLQIPPGEWPFLSMVWVGMTVWMYVQAGVQSGTVSLLGDAWLLSRVWFPREVIPLAPVLAGLIDLAVAGALLALIVVIQGAPLGVELVAVPVVLVVLIVWVAAISMIAGVITVFFRDMATLVGLALRLLFIATPVMYAASTVPSVSVCSCSA